MRKGIVVTIIFLVFLVAAPTTAQSRSIVWREWNVNIDNINTRTNQFDVTESYDIDFTGSFSFGSAVIPQTNLEYIRNVQVSENGTPLRDSCSGSSGTFCAENTDEGMSITYYFSSPINNGQASFDISYTVIGALRVYEGGDQLYWIGVPSDHYGFQIDKSTISVQLPQGFAPREGIDPVESYGVPADVSVDGTLVSATATQPITGDESFELRVQYPHDPQARVASWQPNSDQQLKYGPIATLGAVALALLIFIGGLMGLYAVWYTRGRDPKVGPVPQYLSEPPDDLPPAVVGTLLDERADTRDVISTVVDLARRGYIVMEENQRDAMFGMKSSEFTFKRTDKPLDDLRRFEKRMIDALFNGRMERTLSSLQNSFYAVIPGLQSDLYDAVVETGLFTTSPNTTRGMWSVLGGLLLAAAFVLFFVLTPLAESITYAVMGIPVSLGIVGFIAMFMAQSMPAKTQKGAEENAKWHAFMEYLRNLEKYTDVEGASKHFDDYLAYAIVFGLDRTWVRRFSAVQNVPIPRWYYPTYMGGRYHGGYTAGSPYPNWGGSSGHVGSMPGDLARAPGGVSLGDMSNQLSGGLSNISTGLTSMLSSASSAMTSRPQQTSGSSGRWSSGGRSWSGGGSSRGGGSGGGRRGFG